ncbi:hypothetical protein BGZ76_001399, partial [Entomortierella beljakovae]
PDFYNILRTRVPAEKISFKKKVVSNEEKDGKITIHCEDNTSYTGDILIGADGAHSSIRQNMYKQMDAKGLLPKSDLEEFVIGYTIIVGIAKGDPEKNPVLKEELSQFGQIIYDGDNNCYVITLTDNQISWGFGTQVSGDTVKELHNSGWNVDSGESTLKPFRDFPSPIGGTMGEMFDATPKENISKVYLEEKIFQTWHYGRTVLLGDACHKSHPAGGQGAANAIHDAVILANCIFALKDTSAESIKAAFSDYYNQRFSYAKAACDNSSGFAKILNGQKFSEKLLRRVYLNYIPKWLIDLSVAEVVKYRPQVAWLPLVKARGKQVVLPQAFEKTKNSPVSV